MRDAHGLRVVTNAGRVDAHAVAHPGNHGRLVVGDPILDTVAQRAAVTAELEDLLSRTASPGGTVLLSSLLTAIGSTPGVTDYTVTVPSADVTHTANQLATLSTITWI